MKKSFIIFATSTVLASSILSTASVARGFGGFGNRGMEPQTSGQNDHRFERRRASVNENQRLLRLAPVLNLSEEQIAEIEAIQEDQKEQTEAIQEAMKVAQESLRELSQSETYNEEEATALATSIGGLVSQHVALNSRSRFDTSQVLTVEQKAQLEEIRNAFRSRHESPAENTEAEIL